MSTLFFQATEHPITSVTVFKSSKAEIVRVFSIELKKGQNKIEISALSGSIDTHSVRISGLGKARLFDVVCTIGDGKATSNPADSSSEVIRSLSVKKKAIESERVVREQESQLLLKYAQSLTGEHVSPVQMSQFLDNYVTQGRKIIKSITDLNEQIIDVEQQIKVEQEKSSLKKGSINGRVNVVLSADEDTLVELKLTYIVSNAQWKPTYELHAVTDNGKPSNSVVLRYRARVSQETGEDWTNASLTLSSVSSDTLVKHIPRSRPIILRQEIKAPFRTANQPTPMLFGHQPASFHGRGGFSGFGQTSAFSHAEVAASYFSPPDIVHREAISDLTENNDFEEVGSPSPILEATTIASGTPVAVSFSITGRSTIPSDGVEHQVSIAELTFASKISYITVPRVNPRVFLQCEVNNTSDYRLLPGPVTVILDNSYVSKTSINDINIGDDFICSLGDDPSTKVTYEHSYKVEKSDGGAYSEVTKTTTYTTKISIQNKHQYDITDLIIRHVVPTSEDKRAKIVLRKPAGLGNTKEGITINLGDDGLRAGWEPLVDGKGGRKEGKFEWKWKVDMGTTVNVEAEYDVKGPEEVHWIEY